MVVPDTHTDAMPRWEQWLDRIVIGYFVMVLTGALLLLVLPFLAVWTVAGAIDAARNRWRA